MKYEKKAYQQPKVKVVEIELTNLICGSPNSCETPRLSEDDEFEF